MQQRPKPYLLAAVLFAGTTFISLHAGQTLNPPKMFGIGEPVSIGDLPAGATRDRLASLRPVARERALEWLQRLEFPEADLELMQIDDQGGVLFVEPMLPPSLPDAEQN